MSALGSLPASELLLPCQLLGAGGGDGGDTPVSLYATTWTSVGSFNGLSGGTATFH